MTKYILSIISVIILSSGHCHNQRYALMVKNNTNESIICLIAGLDHKHIYPDTSLPEQRPPLSSVLPSQKGYWDSFVPWDELYFNQLPADTLSIFLLDKTTYDTMEWSKIRQEYKILRRYDLSARDISVLDFTIPFPPTETMRNMKMYPPYSSDQ